MIVGLRTGDPRKPYALKGEATYCQRGHLLGRFNADVAFGETAPEKLTPEPPAYIGSLGCPHCGAPCNVMGQYFFEVKA